MARPIKVHCNPERMGSSVSKHARAQPFDTILFAMGIDAKLSVVSTLRKAVRFADQ
jgi:hypothetical protein